MLTHSSLEAAQLPHWWYVTKSPVAEPWTFAEVQQAKSILVIPERLENHIRKSGGAWSFSGGVESKVPLPKKELVLLQMLSLSSGERKGSMSKKMGGRMCVRSDGGMEAIEGAWSCWKELVDQCSSSYAMLIGYFFKTWIYFFICNVIVINFKLTFSLYF